MLFVTKLKASLRLRLTLTYLGLAIVPLLLVAALAGHSSATELRGLSEALQRAIATRVAQEITSFIDGRFEEIRMFALGSRLARLDAPTQQAILGKLLAHGGFYHEVKLIDASGRRRAHLSRTEVVLTTHGTGRSHGEEFSVPLELGEAYFGQVRFDESLREPLATMSLPVFDLRSGETVFILVAVLRLARVWGLLGQMDLPRGVDVFVLDASSPGGDTPIRRSIERIRAQVQRISRLTNELLSFARTRAAQRTEVVIETLIEETLANRPPPANVVVNRDLPGERVTAFVDQEQIEQILENIASNAYEAMPDGGELTIRVRIEQGLVICALGDTGSGIEPEAIGQVFEPLFTTKREGVGLGLAICKNLTEANRGRLTVDSVVGEGTMFTLALPMVDEG